MDLSVIKLTTGMRCFIHIIVDNFLRYALAHSIGTSFGGLKTNLLLSKAINRAPSLKLLPSPQLMIDSGTENCNENVDQFLKSHDIKRIIAQIDIDFFNSMAESVFNRLKHQYLYYQSLSSFEVLKEKVSFCIKQMHEVIPLDILGGATPLEFISGSWNDEVKLQLAANYKLALKERREINLKQKLRTLPHLGIWILILEI